METEYEQACAEQASYFQDLIAAYFAGRITLAILRLRFEQALRDHLIRLWLLGRGAGDLSPTELLVLQRLLEIQLAYLAGFMADIVTMSEPRARWRSSLYAWNRQAYVGGKTPIDALLALPVLPGEDCLGGNLCQCSWDIQEIQEGYACTWLLGEAEHCVVCIQHSIEWSPLILRT